MKGYKRIKLILLSMICAICTIAFCMTGCGQQDKPKDTTPPVIYASAYSDIFVGDEVEVKIATALDNVDGQIKTTYKVYDPENSEVSVTNGVFTASLKGRYKVVYTAIDKAGNKNTVDVYITCTVAQQDRTAPTITVSSTTVEVNAGEDLVLPTITATDSVDGELSVFINAKRADGKEIGHNEISSITQYPGEYLLTISAANSALLTAEKKIYVTVKDVAKKIDGVDGEIFDGEYLGGQQGRFAGSRDLEYVNFNLMRTQDGLKFAFDISQDTAVNKDERIEIFTDTKGLSEYPLSASSFRLFLYADGRIEYFIGGNASNYWADLKKEVSFDDKAVTVIKLGQGTTLQSGNTDDNGWVMEAFVPYSLIGAKADEVLYFTLGMVREGDTSNWDGWNDIGIFPDPSIPAKFVELSTEGKLFNTNRLYTVNTPHVDGEATEEFYSSDNATTTVVGGLRGLESAKIKIYHDVQGLYVAFDVNDDKKVNNYDRVEICLHVGTADSYMSPVKDFQFWIQASGFMQVMKGDRRSHIEFIPLETVRPEVKVKLHEGTTLGDNTDEDNGYYGELFIPYSFFSRYSVNANVSSRTRLGVTFGMWRASTSYMTTTNWGTDPNKDWDGWNTVNYNNVFCDPLYPNTYAILMPNGNLVSPSEEIEEIGTPTDPSVDGILDEEFWATAKTASLQINKTEELDGITTLIYRDQLGIRVAFKGDAKKISKRDAIAFYVNTRDTYYTIGSDYLDDYYDVRGQYANTGDFYFHIALDRSVQVKRGLYKDWGETVKDLSSISLEINLSPIDCSYIVEAFIPYSFLSYDGYTVTPTQVIGYSVRLAGENSRGSVMWNNLEYAGLYVDSESPASYVRIDADGNVYAALDNSGDYRVDGKFDEAIYSTKGTNVTIGTSTVDIYRSDKGLHVKYVFGVEDSISLVLSTVEHGLSGPYVYDYRITVGKDGTVKASYGHSTGFYAEDIYVPYCAPRAIVTSDNGVYVAELFVSYDYLSRYNTTGRYTPKGYMQITKDSALRFAVSALSGETLYTQMTYNGQTVTTDEYKPSTYVKLEEKGEN